MSVRTTDSWQQNREPDPTAPPPERRRSWFWPAVVVTFVLWVIASCSGAAALVGLDDLSLADFQATGPVWTPPPIPTEPAAVARSDDETDEADVETADAGRFQPGVQARNVTNSRVNVRRSPGYLSKPGDDVLAQLEPGDSVEILGWPRNADGLIWWPVLFGSVEGWVAESTASGVQILAPVQ